MCESSYIESKGCLKDSKGGGEPAGSAIKFHLISMHQQPKKDKINQKCFIFPNTVGYILPAAVLVLLYFTILLDE